MNVITYKAVVLPEQQRADGSYNVKIRVTFKRKTRKLATGIDCKAGDLTRTKKIKSANVLNAADVIITQMRKASSELSPLALEQMDIDDVLAYIRSSIRPAFKLDFLAYIRDFADKKGNPATASYYRASARFLSEFTHKEFLDIDDITSSMLRDFASWLDNSVAPNGQVRKPGTAARTHIQRLGTVYHDAQRRFNDDEVTNIPRDPFSRVSIKASPSEGQHSVGVEVIQMMIDDEAPRKEREALDVFLLSFATMGANLADLFDAQGVTDVWDYSRKKTRDRSPKASRMVVRIDPRLSGIISRLADPSGKKWLALGKSARKTNEKVNRGLASWCVRHQMEPFTFYAARKSFATIARNNAGIDKATVDDMLAHVGTMKIADVYIEKDYNLLNECNFKVLNLFNW